MNTMIKADKCIFNMLYDERSNSLTKFVSDVRRRTLHLSFAPVEYVSRVNASIGRTTLQRTRRTAPW